jgi:hypothetical protein
MIISLIGPVWHPYCCGVRSADTSLRYIDPIHYRRVYTLCSQSSRFTDARIQAAYLDSGHTPKMGLPR